MAKVKKKSKRARERESKTTLKLWLENKIATARKVAKPRTARASRYGAPAGVALLVLLILASLFLPKNHVQKAKERLAQSPNDFEAHLILAEEYLKNNQLKEAERELLLAQENFQFPISNFQFEQRILGETTSTLSQLWQRKMESNPEDIKKLTKAWEHIISEKPDYRDGYLQLALLHYKLYQDETAKEYLEKAIELDPNYELARELEKILEN